MNFQPDFEFLRTLKIKPFDATFFNLKSALASGDINYAAACLNMGVGVSWTDKNGWSPLHTAAHYNDLEALYLLLGYDADVNQRTNRGFTPLHLAANEGHAEVCEVLLNAGADVHAITTEGFTPLHHAANRCMEHIIRLLLKRGADEYARTSWGWTADDLFGNAMRKREFCNFYEGEFDYLCHQ